MPFKLLQSIFGFSKQAPASAFPHLDRYFSSDKKFNRLYPPYIQQMARRHFTQLEVAKKAADFLVTEDGVKILDIGSGAGKFCLAAAYYKPNAMYYGVEQRKNLVEQAEFTKNTLGFTNITFIEGSFSGLDFTQYNGFYFYNSFYENLVEDGRIDDNLPFSKELFKTYSGQLFEQLEKMPAGTKLAAYHASRMEIPPSYHVTREDMDGFLRLCVKA